jgi:hypothetical protein
MIEVHPQMIRSPSGDELVALTRAEFNALRRAAAEAIEEADDIAVFDARTAELRAARDAKLPPEVTASVLRGDSLSRATQVEGYDARGYCAPCQARPGLRQRSREQA